MKWEEQGFGFCRRLHERRQRIGAAGLRSRRECRNTGRLSFSETYFVAIRTTPKQAIEAMVARFHEVIAKLRQTIRPTSGLRTFARP